MSGEQSPIGRDVLYSKSSVYIRSALGRKAVSDFNTYQLFASVALELLGKAALAGHNPCLVAEPSDRKSMLTAAGFEAAANVRTVGASVVYDYLEMVIPNFDRKIKKFCLGIAARRNAELHSADSPFKYMSPNAWEDDYWLACDTILNHMDSSLEQWLGRTDAASVRRLFGQESISLRTKVLLRIRNAETCFEDKSSAEKKCLRSEAARRDFQTVSDRYTEDYDNTWECKCPACKCMSFIAGNQIQETVVDDIDRDGRSIKEIVEKRFVAEEFFCLSCGLELSGCREHYIADLDDYHFERQEREVHDAWSYEAETTG